MGTSLARASATTDLYHRGAAHGILGERVDGMDVRAVKAAGDKAVAWLPPRQCPIVLEMLTYRYRGHSMSDPAKYRTREEVEEDAQRARSDRAGAAASDREEMASEDELKKIDGKVRETVNEAASSPPTIRSPILRSSSPTSRFQWRVEDLRSMPIQVLMPALSPTMEKGNLASGSRARATRSSLAT